MKRVPLIFSLLKSSPEQRLGAVNVLIVDDDPQTVRLLTGVLGTFGFQKIFRATDALQGFKILRDHNIDLVFVDWVMEPLDGLEFVRQVRNSKNPKFALLPIIMLTGRSSKEDVLAARDAGVTEFLAKPFTAQTLADRLIAVVESPRSFVIAKKYKGPDRRRRKEGKKAKERRKHHDA